MIVAILEVAEPGHVSSWADGSAIVSVEVEVCSGPVEGILRPSRVQRVSIEKRESGRGREPVYALRGRRHR